jgi:putative ATPase
MKAARIAVEETPGATVPPHLRSGGYRGAEALGHGTGYRYPHDYPGAVVPQQYLPDAAEGRVLYRPGRSGREAEIADRLAETDRGAGRGERKTRSE